MITPNLANWRASPSPRNELPQGGGCPSQLLGDRLAAMPDPQDYFKHCSTCKTPIEFGKSYYVCSVSTCNRAKLGLFFCSLPCWEAHVPEARHRDAWAEAARAPTRAESVAANEPPAPAPPKAKIVGVNANPVATRAQADDDDDVLVVVSKLKKYIRQRSEMNTSDTVVAPLSSHLRALCNEAIRNAGRDGRRTVMDRDFAPLIGKRPGTT